MKAVKSVIEIVTLRPPARVLALVAGFLALAPARGGAQTPSAQPVPKLSFAYLAPPAHPAQSKSKAAPDSLTLDIHVELADGWHINSEAPLDSFLVPTSLEIHSDGIEFGKPRYPQPMIQHNAVMGDLSLFTGAFDVQVPGRRVKQAAAATGRTKVTLHYQSCNNTMCLPPKSITVEQ
jgi:hypothetical protein